MLKTLYEKDLPDLYCIKNTLILVLYQKKVFHFRSTKTNRNITALCFNQGDMVFPVKGSYITRV